MFYKNWIIKSRIFIVILLLFSSCNENKSIILNPNKGESYEFIKFNFDAESSYAFRESDFDAGASSRLYLGRDVNILKSYVLIKLKGELFSDNSICTQENINSLISIDLKIPTKTDLDDFINFHPDSTQIHEHDFETHPDNQIKAYLLEEPINDDFENISTIHEIDFVDINNISENNSLPVNLNNAFNSLSIDLRGYLYSSYESLITNPEIDCTSLSYSDCICSNWDGENCLQENNDCYWNNPTSIISDYIEGNHCYNDESVQFQTIIENWCGSENSDMNLLLEFTGSPTGNDIIELYSTDNSSLYNSPYVLIKYSVVDTDQEYINKYDIDSVTSEYIEDTHYISNLSSESSQMGMVLGIDNSILSFVDLNNDDNLDCTNPDIDCMSFQSSTVIEKDYDGNLFAFEISLDDEYSDMYSSIDFYFNNVYFVYEELDPSGDNWEDCGTDGDCDVIDENNTQNNMTWDQGENQEGNGRWDYNDVNANEVFDILSDQYELFDDYGLDLCPDENESGNGMCDQENSLYNSEGLENNGLWDQSENGENGDGLCDKDECEIFYDYGFDYVQDDFETGCFNDDNLYGDKLDNVNFNRTYDDIFEDWGQDISTLNTHVDGVSGQMICGEVYWENLCLTCTTFDPNGDNYNIDPANDDWHDCGSDGDCDIEDTDGTQGNNTWDLGEREENNGQYDLGEKFFDYGVDGLPDIYENFNYDIEDDNWDDCGSDGNCDIEDANGTQGNNIWDLGEGTQNNGLWESGEPYFDYGTDWLLSYEEDGFNPSGKENNLNYDYYNLDYKENFDDFGLDQCPNQNELGNNDCCNTNDCEIDLDEFEDPNNDNFLVDPNLDNFDIDNNSGGKENNGELDSSEDLMIVEQYYDYGYDHTINEEENNYYGNLVDLALGSNLYSFDISEIAYNENEENNIITFSKPSFTTTDNLGLWISSIERIGDNTFKLYVDVHSFIDIAAFQFQLKHIPYSNEIESIEDKSLYLFSPEFSDENNNNFPETSELVENGDKYILDASIYILPEWCDIGLDCINSDNNFDISYGYGKKVSLDFIYYNSLGEVVSFEDFIIDNQNSNISNEFTNLVLYFDKSENSTHDVEESSNIIVEYFDENLDFVLFDYINLENVSVDMDSIKINVGPLIQKYINNEIEYNSIFLSSSSSSFNFSNISVIYNDDDDVYNPRLELFYSK